MPFAELALKPSLEELMFSVARLEDENRRLQKRINQLETAAAPLHFPAVQLSTYEGMDGVLRAELPTN